MFEKAPLNMPIGITPVLAKCLYRQPYVLSSNPSGTGIWYKELPITEASPTFAFFLVEVLDL